MRRRLEDRLIALGITPNLRGFDYICEAVEWIVENRIFSMEKIYLSVAENHIEDNYANTVTVARSIRYAIGKVDRKAWREMGGHGMSNSEFLFILAMMERREAE